MRVLLLALLASSCVGAPNHAEGSSRLVFPTSLGEGSEQPEKAPPPARPAPAPEPPPKPVHAPPDPEPLQLAEQWEYELAWDAGEMRVLSVTPRRFPKPIVTARKMGRFAIELWIGQELVERVRFDFPLLALAPSESVGIAGAAPPNLEARAHARQRVLVPAAPRARRAVLVDRATSKVVELPWPPTPSAPSSAPAPSASSSAPAPPP